MEYDINDEGRRGNLQVGRGEIKSLGSLLRKDDFIKNLSKHPKHKFLDIIYQRCNADRVSAGYKPLPKRVYAIKISHLSETDLHFLVKKMQQSHTPAKIFFGMLKVKPKPQDD